LCEQLAGIARASQVANELADLVVGDDGHIWFQAGTRIKDVAPGCLALQLFDALDKERCLQGTAGGGSSLCAFPWGHTGFTRFRFTRPPETTA